MRIEADLKLGFKDVMIRPKRSTLNSRAQVSLERTFVFLHTGRRWTGIPIMASNMDTIGTFSMAKVLTQWKLFTAVHKQYEPSAWDAFLATAVPDTLEYLAVSTGTSPVDWEKLDAILGRHPAVEFICIDVANGY